MAMQLQEFAERVLFGTTIEEKLSFPGEEIIDTKPGSSIKTPHKLTRPKHLLLREDGVRVDHPKAAKLVDEKERGHLLHFFGNHELLAVELMALVLLKFPDAPASFRRGVLETLREEQAHTRMYIRRMKQCGVEFGELPLSDYFWKSVSSMEDPLDYVTRLSLTFEQANLDYSREYKKIFEEVGDISTAKILNQIYRDEIEHVGFGLKWFRRWKENGKTDWEAFKDKLIFPFSPARAKGNLFNSEGRAEAGLDEDFIQSLEVFQYSRGRTPNVWWFNPDAEAFAAANSADGLRSGCSVIQKDLAFLPAYLSRKDDLLFMPEEPSPDFLRSLQDAGFQLPQIIASDCNVEPAPAMTRKISELRPWGWTPDSIRFLENLFPSVTHDLDQSKLWNEDRRKLFSKSRSASLGRACTEGLSREKDSPLAPAEVYGQAVCDLSALIECRRELSALGYPDIVCKAPFGTAANGLRIIRGDKEITDADRKWLDEVFAKQGELVVEPWLDRVFDFSVQFEMRDRQLKVIAFTRLINNARGQFRGIVSSHFTKGVGSEIVRFIMEETNNRSRTYNLYEEILRPYLESELNEVAFEGSLGVDAFVYRNGEGNLKLKPIVELNPRYTMGRVAHELSKHNAANTVGYFEIITKSQLLKEACSTFKEYAERLQDKCPLQLNDNQKPLICSGSVPLTDPEIAKQFLALYHVRDEICELPI